jgi:hypothetical protein
MSEETVDTSVRTKEEIREKALQQQRDKFEVHFKYFMDKYFAEYFNIQIEP